MSIFTLSLLFMSWAQTGETQIISERAPIVAWAALSCVEQEGAIFDTGDDAEEATARLLVRMAYLETRGNWKLVDKMGCAGIIQVCPPNQAERLKLTSDPKYGMCEGLKKLRAHKKQCNGGPAIRWLGAYASGKCGGVPSVAGNRCGPLGLCGRT